MPATEAPPVKADRHKPRRMIAFPPALVKLMEALANKNRRPINWEARLAFENHLRANGIQVPGSPAPEPPSD